MMKIDSWVTLIKVRGFFFLSFEDDDISIVKFQVVERSQHARAEARDQKIREYFYGVKSNLFPHTFDIKFNEIKLFKIGGNYQFIS